jgi:hypothetical protein
MTDIEIENHGSIMLLRPVSDSGRAWVEENVYQDDETQYWGNALVVEPRYISDIFFGAMEDGLSVGGAI